MNHRLSTLVTALMLTLLSSWTYADEAIIVNIKKFKFDPAEITIKAGDTVRWVNIERRQYHSVWFAAEGEPEPDYFWPDETFERHFDKPGRFPYTCEPHQDEMNGVVIVE